MNKLNEVIELTDSNFKDTISKGLTLVDFWAPWCMPCRIQAPILHKVAETVGEKAKIAKLNVDENQQNAAEYGIRSIPTLILFEDGNPIHQFVGVQSEDNLLLAIETALGD
jgi:thioredoxin 1